MDECLIHRQTAPPVNREWISVSCNTELLEETEMINSTSYYVLLLDNDAVALEQKSLHHIIVGTSVYRMNNIDFTQNTAVEGAIEK